MHLHSKNIINNIFFRKCLYKGKIRYIGFNDIGDKYYKTRTTVVIYNDKGEVFCMKLDNGNYMFPGGSLEVAAFKNTSTPPLILLNRISKEECEEECRLEVIDVKFSDLVDIFIYPKKKSSGIPDKVYRENNSEDTTFIPKLTGTISFIFIARYSKKYIGKIEKSDQSPFATKGEWKTYKEIKNNISIKEKEAIEKYVPNSMYNSTENWRMFNTFM